MTKDIFWGKINKMYFVKELIEVNKFENIKNNEQAPCSNCTCYEKCKDTVSNENFEVKCIWYG